MSKLVQDLHFAIRVLRHTPGYTGVALLSLGLGIGGNTAVFSIYDGLLLKQLPVKDPQHLVMLSMKGPFFGQAIFEYDLYDGLKTKARSYAQLAAVSDLDLAMSKSDVAERVSAEMVSGNFFTMLGVRAHYGRTLTVEDDDPSTGALPVVLSYSFWQRRFGADYAAIGKNIWLKGYPFVIVGVLPRRFNSIRVETNPDIRIPI